MSREYEGIRQNMLISTSLLAGTISSRWFSVSDPVSLLIAAGRMDLPRLLTTATPAETRLVTADRRDLAVWLEVEPNKGESSWRVASSRLRDLRLAEASLGAEPEGTRLAYLLLLALSPSSSQLVTSLHWMLYKGAAGSDAASFFD